MITIEDPVEYHLPRLTQVSVQPAQGLGFAEALRATLRQDLDVILVGEIRDEEMAQIAFKAGLTGRSLGTGNPAHEKYTQLPTASGKSGCRASTDCRHPAAGTFPASGSVYSRRSAADL